MSKFLVALCDGHGMSTAGKRTPSINGKVTHENEFNRAVVGYLDIELKRCGFNTLLVAPGDSDVSLSSRVTLANVKGADAYVSIHYNAFDGSFGGADPSGLSVHVYPNSTNGKKLGNSILKYLKTGTNQINRGLKESNFYVLHHTSMPAILSENGFMDNKREALLMLDVNFQKEVAREHCQGICEYFGVKHIPVADKKVIVKEVDKNIDVIAPTGHYFKIQVGAFSHKSYADAEAARLKALGIKNIVTLD